MLLGAALALTTVAVYAQPKASPAGYYISEKDCASGGAEYFFCADGTVIMQDYGSADNPAVSVGKWSLKNEVITMKFTDYYGGVGYDGTDNSGGAWAGTTYNKYKAVKQKETNEITYDWNQYTQSSGCTEIEQSDIVNCNDVHVYLRNDDVKSKYMFASERLLTESELAKYSKDELKIMRNEIFARYNYAFKTKDMKDYFQSVGAYGRLEDVSAFLSEIETQNVETIKKVEGTK